MKGIKYYVLYDYEDTPILYFETLKELSQKLGYNYSYIRSLSFKNNYIDLLINKMNFKLYKFVD